MTTAEALKLLQDVRAGRATATEALRAFQAPPMADLGFAQVDLHRSVRKGFPEVIYGAGKTSSQIAKIMTRILRIEKRLLVTRIRPEQARTLRRRFRNAIWHELARCLTIDRRSSRRTRPGMIAVLCAGTSDLPVAEEAAVTAEILGNRVERVPDIGVAGIHRIFKHLALIREANVVVAVAGMEGALPGVIAGLVGRPVIAVPTSVGYGASFGGLAALLGMLNSCGTGVTVVNIDNGFGAGYAASQINALAAGEDR